MNRSAKDRSPRSTDCMTWLLTNWGNPWSVHRTRKMAIREACEATGDPWEKTRKCFELHRCKVQIVKLRQRK